MKNDVVATFEEIREMTSDAAIIEAMVQYMSTDDLEDFVNYLKRNWDIDDNDDCDDAWDCTVDDGCESTDEDDEDVDDIDFSDDWAAIPATLTAEEALRFMKENPGKAIVDNDSEGCHRFWGSRFYPYIYAETCTLGEITGLPIPDHKTKEIGYDYFLKQYANSTFSVVEDKTVLA